LVTSRVTAHLCFSFQPIDRVFSDALYVFPLPAHTAFAALQSRLHETWARLLSSTLGEGLRYTATDCFENFPFPVADPRAEIPALEDIGARLYEARAEYMVRTGQGLTKTYNAMHAGLEDTAHLRSLHEELDRAVFAAYGWDDLPVPPFGQESKEWKAEVVDRLMRLNRERKAAECASL
jgi:hypothetical protein